jgi:3-phenylpropionate/cinnamic acid dioxygenase small subunit
MLSPQEMSDRLEIQDLFTRYCFAIDDRDWDALDALFTPDAKIDYTATGGAAGPLGEIKLWLAEALGGCGMSQHMVALPLLTIDGDTAKSRMILFNPMMMGDGQGNETTFFVGVWYHDKLVRTADGWRISERSQKLAYTHATPNAKGVRTV